MIKLDRQFYFSYSQILLIWIFISFHLFCKSTAPFRVAPNQAIPVIFIPGYKGSLLKDTDPNKAGQVYLGLSQALGFSSPDLRLKEVNSVVQNGILESVTIPMIYSVDVYESWIKSLKSKSELDTYIFPYDWREDNGKSVLLLESMVKEIKIKTGSAPILIGHSNGALLTVSFMNKHPELVSKAILVAGPFSGGVGFLEDLMVGVPIGLNNKMLNTCVVQTFESIYTFFPREKNFDTREVLFTDDRKPLLTSFFDASFWKEYNLGPYTIGSPCSAEPQENLQKRLNKALKFRESLEAKKDITYPPVLVVRAENRGTIRKIFGSRTNEGWKWKVLEGERVPGDGRVTVENALPPPGIPFSLYVSKAEHSAILNEPETREAIFKFINTDIIKKNN